ncbi:Hypothetical predicted protein [Mytilus galloprovincialis]|uniref:Tripartite motif-containing protein 2 n=1 Tax=Mytilus galloprovincialis TaxID=29158 RepID=A0A8B6CAX3_MYTGA|nr:Hypothetical predicted protein [Mytilus galloprovincialis]
MISNIHALKDRLETEIQWYKNEKEKLEQLLSDGDENFQETKIQIIEAKKEMKKIISTYASDLLEKLEVKWRPVENKIKRQLSTIIKNKNELESRKRLLDKTLLSHQTSDFFCVGQTLDNTLPKKPLGSIQHRKTKFIRGKVWEFESEVSTTFGQIYTVPSSELIDSYETNISIVTKIHCDYNEVVIASWFDEKLQSIIPNRWNRSIRNKDKTRIYDMARQQNGDLILSTRNHNLRQYTRNGKGNYFKSFSPFKTLGVHVSTNDQILVGLVESHGFTRPTRFSVRRVVVMNQDGFIQHTYEYNTYRQRLFSWPRRIITNNDNIYVIDITNKQLKGRVVVLDYEGDIKWTYAGCNSKNVNKSKFTPRDTIFTIWQDSGL